MEHAGLALAMGMAAAFQLLTLIWMLRRKVGRLGLRSVTVSSLRSAGASATMAVPVYLLTRLGDWSEGATAANTGLYVGAVLAGAFVYAGAGWLLGSTELVAVVNILRRRAGRSRG